MTIELAFVICNSDGIIFVQGSLHARCGVIL